MPRIRLRVRMMMIARVYDDQALIAHLHDGPAA
jgi:hypothetical protein